MLGRRRRLFWAPDQFHAALDINPNGAGNGICGR